MGNKSYNVLTSLFSYTSTHNNALILLFAQLVIVLVSGGESYDGMIVTESDHQSLQAIKKELIDPRGVLRSWNGSSNGACSGGWAGIKCSKGQVIAIQLPWKALGGRISDKIGDLKALRKISLHGNFLSGQVPSSIGFLPNLRGLYLFNNRLSGSVPASIGNCRSLQTLDLSNNLLLGPIPSSLSNPVRLLRLNLSFNSLSGSVPISLAESGSLTILALQHNKLSGDIPINQSQSYKNSKLQILTLDHNEISGSIPSEIGKLVGLQTLDLSNNSVNGSLPESLSNLSSLVSLNLAGNRISGRISESLAKLTNLSSLDLSRNNLSGEVPSLLSKKFNKSSFAGNLQLCGYSPETRCPVVESPSPSPESPAKASQHHRRRKLSTKDILLIAAGALLVVLLFLCCFLLCCFLRKRSRRKRTATGKVSKSSVPPTAVSSTLPEVQSGGDTGGKLVHFDGPFVFTADDLLCATAEIMGKSNYGTSYKATLEDGSQVAVKRLREKTTKGHKEFESEAAAIGKIRHPNILALRAYYLGPKGEKLLVYDYMPKGSLASFLHARGPETTIDWATRLNIAIGVTRGLLYLHTEQNTAHGNLTSGNILLDERAEAHIADTGLSRLMTANAASTAVIATAGSMGYTAPELLSKPTSKKPVTAVPGPKADVYGLGVVILELLTGKSPGEPTNGMDLPQWVASIVKEEWTNEVFDLELMRDAPAIGDDLLNVLKLALHCVDPAPEARPDSAQILAQLEDMAKQPQEESQPPLPEEV